MLAAVKQAGNALIDADKSLQKDKAIVLAAVKQDGYALGYADKSLRKDKAIVLAAVKQDGSALQYADKSLRKDKAIVLVAVKQYGLALQYADKSLQKDKAIVLAAIKQDGDALDYVDKSMQPALKKDGTALKAAEKSLQKDKVEKMMTNEYEIYNHDGDIHGNSREEIMDGISNSLLDEEQYSSFPPQMWKDKEFILCCVKAENLVASLLDYIHKSLWSKKKFVIDLLSHANTCSPDYDNIGGDFNFYDYIHKSLKNDEKIKLLVDEYNER